MGRDYSDYRGRNCRIRRLCTDDHGMAAIILVLWITVMLVAIVGEFSFSMRTEKIIARNFKEEVEAYHFAMAGIESAKAEILSAKRPEQLYINSDNVLVLDINKDVPERKGRLGRGALEYKIVDEDGKLNINEATGKQLRHIFKDSGVETTGADIIVDSIIDWRDTNKLHQLNGAEEDYYRSLEKPYSCKDGPFESIEELLLVRGMTAEIFYGTAKTGPEDAGETGGAFYSGVADKLTVTGKTINVNTAPAPVLEAVLGIENAGSVMIQREEGPLDRPPGKTKIGSGTFIVISTGSNMDGTIKRSIKVMMKRNGNELETVYWKDNYLG